MNWGNYIKRTAVRRVVWIVVGLLVYAALSWVGVVHAHPGNEHSSRQEAYEHCMAAEPGNKPQPHAVWGCWTNSSQTRYTGGFYDPNGSGNCIWSCAGSQYSWTGPACPTGSEWRDDLKQCAAPCQGLDPLEGNFNTNLQPIAGSYCVQGCGYNATSPLCTLVTDGPNPGYWCNVLYQPSGQQCEAGEETPPVDPDAPEQCGAGEVQLPNGKCGQQGTCPIGQHEVDGVCHTTQTCPVGSVKGPDGSCQSAPCPFGQAKGKDGTCKHDGNSDGVPDEEQDGQGQNDDGLQFSGGEDCKVAPTCSGDAIMCGQARIQWRIECNTRRASGVTGGDACSDFNMPICTGESCDPVEQKQLILQWRSMCALENMNQDGDGEGDGGPQTFDVATLAEGAVDGASGTVGDGGDPGGAFSDGSEGGGGDGELDTSGLGFGTSCPALPSINVLGTTLDFNVIGPRLCDWMTLGGYIVLILSSLLSLRILAGGMNV